MCTLEMIEDDHQVNEWENPLLPEVEAYYRVKYGAESTYESTRSKVRQDNPVPQWSDAFSQEEREAYYAAREAREMGILKADRDRKEEQAAAYRGVAESSDLLVRWLFTAEELNGYSGHVEQVAKALPMTREEIEEYGERQGWCGEYNHFLELARRAGVLPEAEPEIADITPLVEEFVGWYGGNSRRFRGMIKKHLPEIIESANQRAAEGAASPKTADATA